MIRDSKSYHVYHPSFGFFDAFKYGRFRGIFKIHSVNDFVIAVLYVIMMAIVAVPAFVVFTVLYAIKLAVYLINVVFTACSGLSFGKVISFLLGVLVFLYFINF